ncbi:MAG: hypothetical protein K2Y31_16400 [Burkholderiales bacterium]|jgi:hypothetical protein|nr:hypothetical protein [Burkholderiales bacterium]
MINVPQTLSSEIVDALNEIIRQSDKFRDWDEPEILNLVRSIYKLQKVDARCAFVRLGSVAAICGRVDDLQAYYAKALLHPGMEETKAEFHTSMGNAGLYSKAQEIGTWLLDPRRGFFPRIWRRAASFGQILEVSDRLVIAKKTFPELSKEDFSVIESAATVMRVRGLTDQDIGVVFDLMGEVQRKHGIMFAGFFGSVINIVRPPEDQPYIYMTIPLSESVEFVHSMNRTLTQLVVEKLPGGAFPQGLVTSFSKADTVKLRAAA